MKTLPVVYLRSDLLKQFFFQTGLNLSVELFIFFACVQNTLHPAKETFFVECRSFMRLVLT